MTLTLNTEHHVLDTQSVSEREVSSHESTSTNDKRK